MRRGTDRAEGWRVTKMWFVLAAAAACGGRSNQPQAPRLVPTVALQQWYRPAVDCAQGPFDIEVPVEGPLSVKHGEDIEVRVHTPRRVELHAVVIEDGQETTHTQGVFAAGGRVDGAPENARCMASAGERLAIIRGGGPSAPGGAVPAGGAGTATTTEVVMPRLEPVTGDFEGATEVLTMRVHLRGSGSVKVRLWSIQPNDLAGVVFGVARVTWAPNVPEADYERYQQQRLEDQRRRDEQYASQHPYKPQPVKPGPSLAELEAQRQQIALREAIEEDRRKKRAAFCDAHPEDRDCWGAGGKRVHADLDAHSHERDVYCGAHPEDARCWTDAEWQQKRSLWDERVRVALTGPKAPSGPPPAPLAEIVPPKLSLHAEWRAGYWQWTEAQWVWLAGMWRVPESDIAAEQTTTAPVPPPALQVETPPPAPIAVMVWVPGFWQWGGTSWVWIAGSWQLRPDGGSVWRPAEWRARGSVHVLVPGGWVRR